MMICEGLDHVWSANKPDGDGFWRQECQRCDIVRGGREDPVVDNVNHPDHYTWLPNQLEVIQITEHMGFCLGNAVKYILRCDHKGKPIEDLRKAAWYIEREIARRESAEAGERQ